MRWPIRQLDRVAGRIAGAEQSDDLSLLRERGVLLHRDPRRLELAPELVELTAGLDLEADRREARVALLDEEAIHAVVHAKQQLVVGGGRAHLQPEHVGCVGLPRVDVGTGDAEVGEGVD